MPVNRVITNSPKKLSVLNQEFGMKAYLRFSDGGKIVPCNQFSNSFRNFDNRIPYFNRIKPIIARKEKVVKNISSIVLSQYQKISRFSFDESFHFSRANLRSKPFRADLVKNILGSRGISKSVAGSLSLILKWICIDVIKLKKKDSEILEEKFLSGVRTLITSQIAESRYK
jgi:hypothetical protein